MSFYDYMMRFLKKDAPSGDLARDMEHVHTRLNDEDVYQIRTRDELLFYLRWKHACPECIETAKRCWWNYVKYIASH